MSTVATLLLHNCSLVGKFKACSSPILLNIGSVMTLFELDLLKPLLAKEKPLQSRPLDANRRLEKQGGLKLAPESSDYFQTQSLQ